MTEPAFVQDAMEDLATALRLRPGLWQALRTRSSLYRWQGKTEDALRDLRAAVATDLAPDGLRYQLIEFLLADGQEAEAAEVATTAVRQRPNDLTLKRNFGETFARAGRTAGAARFFKLYFEQVGTEAAALPYLSVLLAQTPPALDEAMAVLQRLPTARSWPLLLFRAQAQFKRGADANARTDIADSLSLIETEAAVQAWYPRFRQACPNVATAADVLSKLRARGVALEEWLEYFRASVLLESPATAPRGVEMLRAMLNPKYGTALRLALCRTLFAFHLANKTDGKAAPQWEEARRACEDGLAVDPADAELNNNLAFLLSEQFGKPAEALPHAEAAAKGAPDNYAVVDTLASVYRRLGQSPRALETLARALTLAATDADRTTCALKLARWKLEAGDRDGAAALADMVAELLIDNPGADSAKADLDQLNKDLRSAPR
jgi:tetratricopeptide (TPR) repeat protein